MVRFIPIVLILSILVLISPISAYTNITECGELNITGETYYLTQNISTIYSCMEITAENVILDCQGYTINGTGGGEQIGIFVLNNSIEVRNCNLTGWGFSGIAIVLAGTNANIYDNNINIPLNGYGISNKWGESFSTSNNTIQNNLIFNEPGGQYPLVSLCNTNYNIISNNTIDYGGEGGSNTIYLSKCNSNTISNNNLNRIDITVGPSVFIEGGHSNIILYNNVTSIQNEGDSNTISYNNISYITITGDSNYLTNNRIIAEENAVTITGSSNQITDNYISSTGEEAYGLELDGDSNEIVRNEIYSEGLFAIRIGSYDNNKVYNNLFSSIAGANVDPTTNTIWNTKRQQGVRIYGAGNEIGGNYWADKEIDGNYRADNSDTCADLNRDGICDTKLLVGACLEGSCQYDYYPLSNKYLPPSNPSPAPIEIPPSYCGDGSCDYELEYKETYLSCPQDCPACGFEMYPSNLEFIIPPTGCITKPLKVRWTCEQLPTQYFFVIPPGSLIVSPKNKQSITFKRYQKRYKVWYEAITNFTVCANKDTNKLFQRVSTYIENQTKPDIYLRAGYEGHTINSYIPIDIKLLGQSITECGNGVCEAGENTINCPKDCKISEMPLYLIIGLIISIILIISVFLKK